MYTFRSIRSRLAVAFLAIILAVMVIISLFLYNLLQHYYISHFQENLTRTGYLAAEFVAGHLQGNMDPSGLSGLAENFSRQARVRVLFIDTEGVVVGDSVRIGGLLGEKLEREEVTAALTGKEQVSIQYSKQTKQNVMQAAVPVQENGIQVGVVFLSAGLREINQTLIDFQKFLLLTTLVVMTVVGGGSIALARRLTNKIELFTSAAAEIAEGNLDLQIPVTSTDEIGRLAEQFNVMAVRLNQI
ncbi:MAG TPA: cell wall metabolism sensor histidine kinase WalK, partial [Firmicutes bacterium]|nr:cell wall metabolism sensor histidine kinase WalK [Bacillota bacterium]